MPQSVSYAERSLWLSLDRDISLRARLAALIEPVAVILGATLVARLVLRAAGAPDADDLLFGEDAAPDFLAAAVAEGLWHGSRYGLVILLALAIGWWRGRRTAAAYGVTLGGRRLPELLAIGVVLGVLVSLPLQVLHIVHEHVPLGTDTRFWILRDRVAWDAAFWIYMAVGSFLIVPLVEEFTARGYTLGRLRESYSPGAALVLMAAFFALAHGQYHRLEILAIGQLASLVLLSVALGYAVYRTGSLIPAIVAHGLINIPLSLTSRYVALGASLAALILFWRPIVEWLRALGRLFRDIDDWMAALPAIGLIATALLTLRVAAWAPYAWLAVFLVILIAGLGVRSSWTGADRMH